MATRPNILLITADQWRGEALSALRHPVAETPNLDRLAADGVTFRRHYANSSPCGPSRASLLTGLYAMTHRSVRNGTPLDARFTNLALELRKAGYAPALFGYTDTSADPRTRPADDPALFTYEGVLPGFDPIVVLREDRHPWLAHLRHKGYDVPAVAPVKNFSPQKPDPKTAERGPTYAPTLYGVEDSDTAFLTDCALDLIASSAEQPWCVHISYLRPHPPFVAPAPYHDRYDPASMPSVRRAATAEAEAARHPWLAYHLDREREAIVMPEPHVRQLRATYYGMIAEVDHHLGRLFDALRHSGDYDETLIAFTSDHGEMLGDHWFLGKDGFFDPAFHVPLIVKPAPGAGARGRVVEAFSEHVDVMPTLLDLVRQPIPAQCDGRSLRPWLDGGTPADWRRAAHWEYDFRDVVGGMPETKLGLALDDCCLAVHRGPKFKYVHFAGLPPLLFDMERDPHELDNLSNDPTFAGEMLRGAQELLSWRLRHAERTLSGTLLTSRGPISRR
jgi:arylsulfatase A-like enzyme